VRLALPGPHNAKNALAALLAAEAAGLPIEDASRHLATWVPPRRRLEVTGRGAASSSTTTSPPPDRDRAPRWRRCARAWPARRAARRCFEPRSNTMVRKVFERALGDALSTADAVFLGAVDRPERFPDEDRLDVAGSWRGSARAARGLGAALAGRDPRRGRRPARAGDVVRVMSNGAFGGLARRLGEAVAARGTA